MRRTQWIVLRFCGQDVWPCKKKKF
jgi:hypothetical protein